MIEDQNIKEQDQEDELYEHYRVVADPKQEALRIDKFLCDRLPNASRNKIQSAIKGETILLPASIDNIELRSLSEKSKLLEVYL